MSNWTSPKTWSTEPLLAVDLNTHLRDNLNALKTPPTAVTTMSGPVAITATSLTDVSGMTLQVTTSGGDLSISTHGILQAPAAGWIELRADLNSTSYVLAYSNTTSTYVPLGATYLATALNAGLHTIKLRARVSGGSGNLRIYQFWVREVS
jgi:hypothetical protein